MTNIVKDGFFRDESLRFREEEGGISQTKV